MAYTVKAVAEFAGVSIRTLHHYDEIGLLKPDGTSRSGYRLYSDSDLEHLQEILFFKELGFGLQEIKTIMNGPGYDREQALRSHKRILFGWMRAKPPRTMRSRSKSGDGSSTSTTVSTPARPRFSGVSLTGM